MLIWVKIGTSFRKLSNFVAMNLMRALKKHLNIEVTDSELSYGREYKTNAEPSVRGHRTREHGQKMTHLPAHISPYLCGPNAPTFVGFLFA